MATFAEILEEELKEAVQVKNRKSLHRYIALLTDTMVYRIDHMVETGTIKSDIQVLAESMREGFKRMDERFEAVDKRFEDSIGQMNSRFEDVNRRFNMMFTFMTIGFTMLTILMSLYKFII